MIAHTTYLVSLLSRAIDWFIPANLASSRRTHQQARMFLVSHIFGPLLSLFIPAYLYHLSPESALACIVIAVSIGAFWTFPFLLRWTGRYTLLAVASIQNLTFAVLWGCYFFGGVSSPFLPWLLTIPLLGFFYLGGDQTARYLVLGTIAGNLLIFSMFYLAGHEFPTTVPLERLQIIGLLSILSASAYVTMMALYYANILASSTELEHEVHGHLTTAAELREATAAAERASIAKSEFLAKMSHELRTPLNAVIGYSEILLENPTANDNSQAVADIERIRDSGKHLLRLVNDVLDLSKIEAGKMELCNETVSVSSVILSAIDNVQALADSNGNTIVTRNLEQAGDCLCDAAKLQRALCHIVQNAARFTRDGTITVSASRTGGRIAIAVRDTGPGIPAGDIPKLFEKFSAAADKTASQYGGAGMGLALSQRLCRLMGGDIQVESTVGVGSCFTLVIPTEPPASQMPAQFAATA